VRRGDTDYSSNDGCSGMQFRLSLVDSINKWLLQDVFVIPDGAQGALAELERRKFTAEEGVSHSYDLCTHLRFISAMH